MVIIKDPKGACVINSLIQGLKGNKHTILSLQDKKEITKLLSIKHINVLFCKLCINYIVKRLYVYVELVIVLSFLFCPVIIKLCAYFLLDLRQERN